jgi:hypothetical protein
MLARFTQYLNGFPPSPELGKAFLAQFAEKKPRTLYRYAQMIKMFMKWYGEPIEDFKIKIPKSLPPYFEDGDIEKLLDAIESKGTHRGRVGCDVLMAEVALKTGLRRGAGTPVARAEHAAYRIWTSLKQNHLATASEWGKKLAEDAEALPFYLRCIPARLLIAQDKKSEVVTPIDTTPSVYPYVSGRVPATAASSSRGTL